MRVYRGVNIFTGCAQLGASGTAFANLIMGATCFLSPSGAPGFGFAASISIPGVDTNSTVIAIPSLSMQQNYTQWATCPIANGINLAFANVSGSNVSSS